MSFFEQERRHFFKPLTWRARERMADSVKAIYDRLYGPDAVFNTRFDRPALHETISRALALSTRPAWLLGDDEESTEEPALLDAAKVIRELESHGWLEVYTDTASVEKTWRLTPVAKKFARALWESDRRRDKTRQRNMRSCALALESYVGRGDVDDLIDAQAYAGHVLEDLSNDIEDFRLLIKEQNQAALNGESTSDDFADFITSRFQREYTARLVADSAEGLKSRITEALDKLRAMGESRLNQYDSQLQTRDGEDDAVARRGRPVLRRADLIERTVRTACDTKLPELQSVLAAYITRMTNQIRESAAARASGETDQVQQFAERAAADKGYRNNVLSILAEHLATSRLRLFEPKVFRFEAHALAVQVIDTPLEATPDPEGLIEAAIIRDEEQHLSISAEATLQYIADRAAASGGRVLLSSLEPLSPRELLMVLASRSTVAEQEEDCRLKIRHLTATADTTYFTTDDVEFELQREAS